MLCLIQLSNILKMILILNDFDFKWFWDLYVKMMGKCLRWNISTFPISAGIPEPKLEHRHCDNTFWFWTMTVKTWRTWLRSLLFYKNEAKISLFLELPCCTFGARVHPLLQFSPEMKVTTTTGLYIQKDTASIVLQHVTSLCSSC